MRVLLLAALATVAAAASTPLTGVATQFGGPADKLDPAKPSLGLLDGACGYGEMNRTQFPFFRGAGISLKSPLLASTSAKAGCGLCVKVACDPRNVLPFSACKPGVTPVTVMIVDSCPKCDPNQINIHASAFNEFLSPTVAKVGVTMEAVPCEPRAPFWIKVTDARQSAGGYIRLSLQGVAGSGAVSSVEVRPTGGVGWTKATNAWGATWEASRFGDTGNLDLRVVGDPGTPPVEAQGAIQVKKGVYGTALQVNGGAGGVSTVPLAEAAAPSKAVAAPAPAAAAPAAAAPAPAPAKAAPAPTPAPTEKAAAPPPAAKEEAVAKEETKDEIADTAAAVPPPTKPAPPADTQGLAVDAPKGSSPQARAVADILADMGLRATGG